MIANDGLAIAFKQQVDDGFDVIKISGDITRADDAVDLLAMKDR
jgi:hypothetical protein